MASDNRQPEDSDKGTVQTLDQRMPALEEAKAVPVSPSILFGVLADTRQRFALYYLMEHDGRGTLNDMADRLAAWEDQTTVELTSEDAQNRVKSNLYHADLPKLDDYGFITFDAETHKVTATDQLEQITSFLDVAQSLEADDYERFRDLLSDSETPDHQR